MLESASDTMRVRHSFQIPTGSRRPMQSSGMKRSYISMADSAYLVRFKGADPPPELVIAETIEVYGEHLVFLKSDGSLAALFVLEIVESWAEIKIKL